MKNYDEMPDSEINWRVHLLCNNVKEGQATMCCQDFCNDPSDAWPVIVESNISIVKRNHTEWLSTWSEYGCHMAINDIYVADKNPLRAAMICYLKMRDNEKCK